MYQFCNVYSDASGLFVCFLTPNDSNRPNFSLSYQLIVRACSLNVCAILVTSWLIYSL
jgi:hypothetical protein